MYAIGDDRGIFGTRQCGPHNPRRAVMQGRHRIEQMGEPARTGIKRGTGGLVVRIRMPDLHGDSRRGKLCNGVQPAFDFRRQGDKFHDLFGAHAGDEIRVGCARMWRLRTQSAGIDVRPFHMGPQHTRFSGLAITLNRTNARQSRLQVGFRRGDRSRQK